MFSATIPPLDRLIIPAFTKLDATAEETMSPIERRPMLSSLPSAE